MPVTPSAEPLRWTEADLLPLFAPAVAQLPPPTSLSPLPYDLNAGVPDRASLPAEALAEAAVRALRTDPAGALTYGGAQGYVPLRAWIAEQQALETGLPVTADWITLCSGSAHAIDNIAATFLAPGDVVVMGAPTYPGAIRAFSARGARIVDVPQDEDGLEMVSLAAALERQRSIGQPAKLIYVIANYDNPSGATLSEHRREELALLAARYRALVVEDDAYTGIDLDGPPPTSLFEIAHGQGIMRVGTFSKTIATGLRVGWIVADPAIVQRLVYMRFDNGSSPLLHRIVHEYLLAGHHPQHLERIRAIYRERRDTSAASLSELCGQWVDFEVPRGGFFHWLHLREGLDAGRVAVAAREHGVAVTPGTGYYAHGGGRDHVRLVYSALPPDELRAAISAFAQGLADVAGAAGGVAPR